MEFIEQNQPDAEHIYFDEFNNSIDAGIQDEVRLGTKREMQPGRAYLFDGTNFITAPRLTSQATVNKMRVKVRVKLTVSGELAIIGNLIAGNVSGWELNYSSNNARFRVAMTFFNGTSNITYTVNHTATLTLNKFYDLDFVFNKSTGIEFMIDGVRIIFPTNGYDYVETTTDNSLFIGKRSNNTNYLKGCVSDAQIYYNDVLLCHYKLDEGAGSVAYDSSGNNRHGNWTGLKASSHYTGSDVPYSYQNEVGYSLNAAYPNVFIPRNEASPSQDIFGNLLTYAGKAPVTVKAKGSHCGYSNGTHKLSLPDLSGVTIISYQGTSIATISDNQINLTAGTIYNLVLSNGWKFPISEGVGGHIHNIAGGAHATLTGDITVFWSKTQDAFHYNLSKGFGLMPLQNLPFKVGSGGAAFEITPDYIVGYGVASSTIRLISDLLPVPFTTYRIRFEIYDYVKGGFMIFAGRNNANRVDFPTTSNGIKEAIILTGSMFDTSEFYNGFGFRQFSTSDNAQAFEGKIRNFQIENLVKYPAMNNTQDIHHRSLSNPAGPWYNYPESALDFSSGISSPYSLKVPTNWKGEPSTDTLTYRRRGNRADRFCVDAVAPTGQKINRKKQFTEQI